MTPAPSAETAPETAFGVLLRRRGPLIDGQVVFALAEAMADAIAAGDARPATEAELAISDPYHFPLPQGGEPSEA